MISRVLIACVRTYQVLLSPLKLPVCRFYPSCSAYVIDALRSHGAVKGSILGAWRIVRCNPLCRGGYDPVPPAGKRRAL